MQLCTKFCTENYISQNARHLNTGTKQQTMQAMHKYLRASLSGHHNIALVDIQQVGCSPRSNIIHTFKLQLP